MHCFSTPFLSGTWEAGAKSNYTEHDQWTRQPQSATLQKLSTEDKYLPSNISSNVESSALFHCNLAHLTTIFSLLHLKLNAAPIPRGEKNPGRMLGTRWSSSSKELLEKPPRLQNWISMEFDFDKFKKVLEHGIAPNHKEQCEVCLNSVP